MGFLECFVAVQDAICATLATVGYTVELLVAVVLNRQNASLGPTPKVMVQARQLNDSVYELYRPVSTPTMQVIFFHGFQLEDHEDAHLSTWKSRDGDCIWPQTWLAEEFPNAQILCVSYNAHLTRTREVGNADLYITGENLASDVLQANIGQDRRCPVILVGHGFGCLVIKQLLSHGQEFRRAAGSRSSFANSLDSLKGIFFYSTPHHGIPFDIAAHFVTESPLLEYVKVLSKEAARLEFRFQNLCNRYKTWQIAGLGEGLPIQRGRFHGLVVVPEAASRYGTNFNIVEGADHISICQPKEKTSRSFNALTTLVGNIVSDSKTAERPGGFQCLVLKPSVGIDDVLEDVKRKLDNATSLGLVGMGGIGKTTMAMALFNALGPQYDYTCFIKDVKYLQGSVEKEKAVLAHMHHHGRKATGNGGLEFLKNERLLLILDDVAYEEDLEMMSILCDTFRVHKDSRFIATSRDKELLDLCLTEVYTVPFLSFESSKHLLLTCAFPDGAPLSYEQYTDTVVEKCAGLPLTLEVMGKYLHRKSETIWKQAIEALDKANGVAGFNEKLWAKLKVSYDGLDKVEQNMFLDATTIFRNKGLEEAKASWSSTTDECQDIRWQHLLDLSLVWEIPSENSTIGIQIGLHEQLLSLGRKISLTSGNNGYRIWERRVRKKALELLSRENYNLDDIQDILALILKNSDSHIVEDAHKDIVALKLDYSDLDTLQYSDEGMRSILGKRVSNLLSALSKSRRLQYLSLTGINIDQASLPTSLLYLSLKDLTFSDLPFNPSDHKLMAILYIRRCDGLLTLPATFGQLLSLRSLSLICRRLKSFPASFGQLSSLRELEIACPNLRSLPDSFGQLQMLKAVCLHSQALTQLPETFGDLKALEVLQLFECNALTRLPDSLGHLPKLKELRIECRALKQLPETIGNLEALETLILGDCNVLTRLPDSLGHLPMLKDLQISCRALRQLPETIDNLKALEFLSLENCHAVKGLPTSFGCLSRLTVLEISDCPLQELPDSFGELSMLYYLRIHRTALEKLPSTFGDLKSLEFFNLNECNLLTALPDSIGSLSSLKRLEIWVCRLLEELPDTVLQLQGLEHIELLWTSVRTVPNLENLRSLTTLKLHWCEEARFPMLPKCLGEVITEKNYNRSPFEFNVVDGQFTIYRVDKLLSSRRDPRGGRKALGQYRASIQTSILSNTALYWQQISSERGERGDCGSEKCEPEEGGEGQLVERKDSQKLYSFDFRFRSSPPSD